MSNADFECKQIQEVLDRLNALEPLPVIGTPESRDHQSWNAQCRVIENLERDAEQWALLSVPPEVATLMKQVQARRRVLWNMKPLEEAPNA